MQEAIVQESQEVAPGPQMHENAYVHDAFSVLSYQDEQGNFERIWNSRKGNVLTVIPTADGRGRMRLEPAARPRPIPQFSLRLGARVFIDMTFEKARQYAMEYASSVWEVDGELRASFSDIETAIDAYATAFYDHGRACDLVIVTEEVLRDLNRRRSGQRDDNRARRNKHKRKKGLR